MNKLFINQKLQVLAFSLLACVVLLSVDAQARVRRVLYIGNSYIFTNNMPGMVDSIARSFGDTIIYDQNTPGGYTFNQHSRDGATISKIFSRRWDVVVLQEQSQAPSFSPSQVATDVYPYAKRLDSMVNASDTCTQTMFLMTWGRANGDASNCPFYPPVCTYGGMQKRLRESYMEMADSNNALVAPVGMAFKVFKDSSYGPLLYSPDSSHPSVAGTYLEACTIYSSIFHKRTLNCTYQAGLVTPDAMRLQRIADKVVFDSVQLWQQQGRYPFASFASSVATGTATFINKSLSASKHLWNFGDSRTDTARNPVHNYTATGRYLVTYKAYDNCFEETVTDSVIVTSVRTGLNDMGHEPSSFVRYSSDGGTYLDFHGMTHYTVDIYNVNGSKVLTIANEPAQVKLHLPPGLYIYKLVGHDPQVLHQGKLTVF